MNLIEVETSVENTTIIICERFWNFWTKSVYMKMILIFVRIYKYIYVQ